MFHSDRIASHILRSFPHKWEPNASYLWVPAFAETNKAAFNAS